MEMHTFSKWACLRFPGFVIFPGQKSRRVRQDIKELLRIQRGPLQNWPPRNKLILLIISEIRFFQNIEILIEIYLIIGWFSFVLVAGGRLPQPSEWLATDTTRDYGMGCFVITFGTDCFQRRSKMVWDWAGHYSLGIAFETQKKNEILTDLLR